MTDKRDVLVVGAGPAGSTAAAMLARAGVDVLILEKQHFPRFHIGESLLPAGVAVLQRLRVEPTADTFVYKRGAEFVCEASNRAQSFAFDESLPGCPRHAWHVDRASFDTRLSECALDEGAEIRFGETALDAGADDAGAWVETRNGTLRGRYLIDASGQSRLLARRANSAVPYSQFGVSAVFSHFEEVGDAAFAELGPGFDIRIMLRPEGWGWIIPLPHARLSIGMVSKGKLTPECLDAGLLSGPLARRLTAGATRLPTHVVGNFSYRNTAPTAARCASIGDAACFLDPVFSSGVTLALRGAESAVSVIAPALATRDEARPDLLAEHNTSMDRAYRTFAALIERFYNMRFAESMLLREVPDYAMRRGVMSVLAGDVWRFDNPFQDLLLSARRSKPRGTGPESTGRGPQQVG